MSRRQGSIASASGQSSTKRQSGVNRLRAAGFTATQPTASSMDEQVSTVDTLRSQSGSVASQTALVSEQEQLHVSEVHAFESVPITFSQLQSQLGLALTNSLTTGELSIAIKSLSENSIASREIAQEGSVLLSVAQDYQSTESTAQKNDGESTDEIECKVVNGESSTDEEVIAQTCDMKEVDLKSTVPVVVENSSPSLVAVDVEGNAGSVEDIVASSNSVTAEAHAGAEATALEVVENSSPSLEAAKGNVGSGEHIVVSSTSGTVEAHAGAETATLEKVRGRKRAAIRRFFGRGLICFT